MSEQDRHPLADLRAVLTAVAESLFYRRMIFDPPSWPGWPARFHPLAWRKVRR
jgi:hypothetical protein